MRSAAKALWVIVALCVVLFLLGSFNGPWRTLHLPHLANYLPAHRKISLVDEDGRINRHVLERLRTDPGFCAEVEDCSIGAPQ